MRGRESATLGLHPSKPARSSGSQKPSACTANRGESFGVLRGQQRRRRSEKTEKSEFRQETDRGLTGKLNDSGGKRASLARRFASMSRCWRCRRQSTSGESRDTEKL